MARDITHALVEEHRLILRMLALLERRAELVSRGENRDFRFFLDAVDFIRNYADRFHHAKEEDVLFEALVKNGMPKENSPVAAMLMEHDKGREFVRGMEEAALQALSGKEGYEERIAENARGYLELLREHISREDTILYPLAERVMKEELRDEILEGYRQAGLRTPELEERYRALVEQYERSA